jgi:hypothetical protein
MSRSGFLDYYSTTSSPAHYDVVRYHRRKSAAEYLLKKYGFGAYATLAKLAVTGGGPHFCKVGRMVVYREHELDAWALSKISAPRRSTSAV